MATDEFIEIELQGTTYRIPRADATPPWGEQLQDYLEALGSAFSTVVGPADIQQTIATIANNQSSAANVTGLSFDSSTVRAAFIDYSIYRTTNTTTKKEVGTMKLVYDATASVGTKWAFDRETISDSDVTLTVTDGGQVQYVSTNMTGTGYAGIATFRARSVLQS